MQRLVKPRPDKNSRLQGLSPNATVGAHSALRALELGDVGVAYRHIVGLMALYPDHPEVLRLFAGVQNLRGEVLEAVETMRRATAIWPDDALLHDNLGSVLLACDEYEDAVSSFGRACELEPTFTGAWYHLGVAQMYRVRTVEAVAAFQRAADLSQDQTDARAMLGFMLTSAGRVDEAIAECRGALAVRPYAGMAWWNLASIKTVRFKDTDIEAMKRALKDSRASDQDRVATGLALAKALDERGCYAEALAELNRAHGVSRRHLRWDASAHAAHIDALIAAFRQPLAEPKSSDFGREVIFIVSLPRSGSTLVEQVLASHSQVEGAAELTDVTLVLTQESRRRGKPLEQWARDADDEDWQRLGQSYLERTARWREGRPRFTDKMPGNWMYVGAIRAMLPGARIVAVRRDPLETCFSCYRQQFAKNQYTHSFSDLASTWRDFDRAVRHWRELHSTHVYESSYERLVAEPDAAIRDLLAFCDLPFEQACLEFHKTERGVYTPSAAQVREPLRRDTARSQRYGALLDPLRAELGMPAFDGSGG